jgi:cytochrome oxidase Cu insertion factor (SCO1/SenC/PrrC family)
MTNKNMKAGRWKSILMLVLVFGPASLLILISTNKCEHKFEELPFYGALDDFELYLSDGTKLTPENQLGKITLFTTIQATCPNTCALNIPQFNLLLYQHYRKNRKKLGHIQIVSIMTDEDGNPTGNFDEITFLLDDMINDYDPEIWMLASGDPKQIFDVTNNNVRWIEQRDDQAFAGKPYLETMMIVDKENNIRLLRRGSDEGNIRDFKQHVALLQKQYDKDAFKAKGSSDE